MAAKVLKAAGLAREHPAQYNWYYYSLVRIEEAATKPSSVRNAGQRVNWKLPLFLLIVHFINHFTWNAFDEPSYLVNKKESQCSTNHGCITGDLKKNISIE
jgi:hypothetical protein